MSEITSSHEIVRDRLNPCQVDVAPDGRYRLSRLDKDGAPRATKWCYERDDPQAQQAALAEALPGLYLGYRH